MTSKDLVIRLDMRPWRRLAGCVLLHASQPCRLSSPKACSCYFYFWDLSFTGQERKQKNTAQSHGKIGQRSPTHPGDFLTCIQSSSLGGITGSLPHSPPPPLLAIFSQLVLELEPATFHPLGLLLYTLVHRLLQGFLRPRWFTKKVTCWRPESHGNASLFVWPDNFCCILLRVLHEPSPRLLQMSFVFT